VFSGHLEVALELIKHGAWLNVKDNQGRFPLYFACGWGGEYGENGLFTKILLDAGADISAVTTDEWSALYLASFKGRVAAARHLVQRGADIFQADTQGRTPYDIAVLRKNAAIQTLIKAKAEELFREGAKTGDSKIVKKIVNSTINLNVNAPEADGSTALHHAMKGGHENIVKLLIQADADPFVTDSKGRTPQSLAAEQGNLVLLKMYHKFLQVKGVSVDLPKSVDILRRDVTAQSLAVRNAKSQSLLLHKRSVNSPTRKKKMTSRLHMNRSTSSVLLQDKKEGKNISTFDKKISGLSASEEQKAAVDSHLSEIVKYCTHGGNTNFLSNSPYDAYLCHLEEYLHLLEKANMQDDNVTSILHSVGIKSNQQIKEAAQSYDSLPSKLPFIDEKLIEQYLQYSNLSK